MSLLNKPLPCAQRTNLERKSLNILINPRFRNNLMFKCCFRRTVKPGIWVLLICFGKLDCYCIFLNETNVNSLVETNLKYQWKRSIPRNPNDKHVQGGILIGLKGSNVQHKCACLSCVEDILIESNLNLPRWYSKHRKDACQKHKRILWSNYFIIGLDLIRCRKSESK